MKKILGLFFLVLILAAGVLFVGSQPKALATQPEVEQCNNESDYTKSDDFSNSKVNINFHDSDEQIDVSAGAGYAIVDIWLEVDGVNVQGYDLHFTSALNNYNPDPGGDIDEVKVVVRKVCREVCNDGSALKYEAVVAGQTVANNSLCQYEEETSHLACVNLACVKVEGEGENTCNIDADCQEVSPTPTQTPPNTGGPGDGQSDGRGCASHDCSNQPQGQVLGASTGPQVLGLSTTSSGSNSFLNLFQLLGAFTLTASGFSFFKKNA